MGLRDIKHAVDREHPDWTNKQKVVLIKELRDQERGYEAAGRPFDAEEVLATRAGRPPVSADRPAPEKSAMEPRPEDTSSVGGAIVLLILLVAVPRLIGLGMWDSIYDEPGWWNVMNAVLTIFGIVSVVSAVKNRSAGGPPSA